MVITKLGILSIRLYNWLRLVATKENLNWISNIKGTNYNTTIVLFKKFNKIQLLFKKKMWAIS